MEHALPKMRVSITDKCQLRCVFCGGDSYPMENFQPDEMVETIPTETLLQIIEQYILHGGTYIQFTGGEPLLRKDLDRLVRETFAMGGIPEINTNGIALDVQRAKRLAALGINVIKVSVPSFDRVEYQNLTGADALEKVLDNVSRAKDYVQIRLNMVATRNSMKHFNKAVLTCYKLGIRQLLLLELLYYPHVAGGIDYFRDQYVDILGDCQSEIVKTIGRPLQRYCADSKFESIYCAKSTTNDLELFVKQACTVLRIKDCSSCNSYCQEGVYELRLSTGGYLSFCNITNPFGVDVSSADKDTVAAAFQNYQALLRHTVHSSFKEFFDKHLREAGVQD